MDVVIVLSILGPMALTAVILVVVFTIIGRVQTAAVARLEPEGIVLRSGRTWVTTVLRNYRSATRYSGGRFSKGRGELVLTREALVLLATPMSFRFSPADLAQVEASADGEVLLLVTDRPPDASGRVQLKVKVGDPSPWLSELRDRGARA